MVGEIGFDQQSQHVGQQFNADRQEFTGKWVSNQYVAEGGQVTVNHHADHVDSPDRRVAADLYVTLGQAVDLSLRFRSIAAAGSGARSEVHELQILVHQAMTACGNLRAGVRRFRAVSKSDASADLAEKITLSVLDVCLGTVNVVTTTFTGKAMRPRTVRHLNDWPTPEALASHLHRLHREFLDRIVRA
ncbi:hypothetical protein [Streptomyces sp. NPDC047985]|uniref:hypothetical protein n=1 Tax=Streptomyces sp. NPDC047985 TaxID=3155384 RepID=UPI003437B513